MNKHPIGLLGGTFDPIHCGHLAIAEKLIDKLDLQEILFIPNKNPMHRDKPDANATHRLAMTRIATARYPKFIVSDVEINRQGPTYSIDTITAIREQIPKQPLCLILGEDVFASMHQWQKWEKIPDLVHLIIINRPGVTHPYDPDIQTLLDTREMHDIAALTHKPGGYIMQHLIDPLSISATEIRKKLKTGEDVSQEVPPEVLRYIKQHHLYSITRHSE